MAIPLKSLWRHRINFLSLGVFQPGGLGGKSLKLSPSDRFCCNAHNKHRDLCISSWILLTAWRGGRCAALAGKPPRRREALQTPTQAQEGLCWHNQHREALDVLRVSRLPATKLEAGVNRDPVLVLVLIAHLGSRAGGISASVGPVRSRGLVGHWGDRAAPQRHLGRLKASGGSLKPSTKSCRQDG